MDNCSSGEEVLIKARKPYTITKQRERWTEDEHSRFLEALKLYGRAWQRIEEHVGTKTAVQIRSHAQKFFAKLEKEALAKGIPLGRALDIEIPPPRPKRKPSNPYPRKIASHPASQEESMDGRSVHPTSSLPQAELTIDLEKEPLPEKMGGENLGNGTEYQDGDTYPKKRNLVQGSLGTSSSPALMAPKNCYACNEVVPALDEVANMGESNESQVTVAPGANQILHELCSTQSFEENGTCKDEKLNRTEGIKLKQCETFEGGPKDDWQFVHTQARHASVQILDGSSSLTAPNASHDALTNLSSCEDHCGGSGSSVNQTFHPNFGAVQNPDSFQSLVHVSSTFSNLIISALLPNPTVHAAARFAATFWPTPNIDAAAPQVNAAPSVAAIAAATVAAATAWWASNGLLPGCAPYHYVPAPPSVNQKTGETTHPALESEICKQQHSTWRSAPDGLKSLAVPEAPDSDKVKGRKQMDRSSCGSNTASSSEVDTDALEKHGKGEEESREPPTSDRRSRGSSTTTDSWKEVSQEGRQAFQALFSRQVLPQSFSPPYALSNSRGSSNSCCISQQAVNNPLTSSSTLKEEGQLTLGKLKVRCTGFKPYKRCSVEAKDSVLVDAGKGGEGEGEGKCPKRIRLDADAYTH